MKKFWLQYLHFFCLQKYSKHLNSTKGSKVADT